MNKLLISLALVLISGCDSTIHGPEIIWANAMCSKNDGVSLVSESFSGNFYVTCNNGKRYNKVAARWQRPQEISDE